MQRAEKEHDSDLTEAVLVVGNLLVLVMWLAVEV